MKQKELELILTRQLAECLGMPVFIVDEAGRLLYYNEPAEAILGRRFEETGEMTPQEWGTVFTPTDRDGRRLTPGELPLVKAMETQRPAHTDFWIEGLDVVRRHIQVTAFPLIGRVGRAVGAVAIFWED